VPSVPTTDADPARASFAGGAIDLFALDGDGDESRGTVPTTIPLAPIGDVEARDGRFFRLPEEDVSDVIARTRADYPDGFVLDWWHDAESGHPVREAWAAAWIDPASMRIEGGLLVADVEWTEDGARSVASRSVRYISPAFIPDAETRVIQQFTSAALTNTPALRMPALNNRESADMSEKTNNPSGVRAVLGLQKDATHDEITALVVSHKRDAEAFAALKLEHGSTIELLEASKGQLANALGKIEMLERADADRAAEAFEVKRDQAIMGALEAGKITPAEVDKYTAIARDEAGLTGLVDLFSVKPDMGLTKVTPGLTEPPKGTTEASYIAGYDTAEEFSKAAGVPLAFSRKKFEERNQ